MLIIIALGAFAATFTGGLLALRFRDKLHLILGFSAGAVIGVAFFDLLPESLELGQKFHTTAAATMWVALGFLAYLLLDRLLLFHAHHHDNEELHDHCTVPSRGVMGAGSLSLHSFLDGVAIGLGFQVSPAVGVIVAIAVLTHDFSDGINTVSFLLKHGSQPRQALRWLLLDAVAPVLGVASTFMFTLPERSLSLLLALFTGFFLYIGASELIPESYHRHPKLLTTLMTLLGAVVLYAAVRLAG
jgi:zinc transporter ZupT